MRSFSFSPFFVFLERPTTLLLLASPPHRSRVSFFSSLPPPLSLSLSLSLALPRRTGLHAQLRAEDTSAPRRGGGRVPGAEGRYKDESFFSLLPLSFVPSSLTAAANEQPRLFPRSPPPLSLLFLLSQLSRTGRRLPQGSSGELSGGCVFGQKGILSAQAPAVFDGEAAGSGGGGGKDAPRSFLFGLFGLRRRDHPSPPRGSRRRRRPRGAAGGCYYLSRGSQLDSRRHADSPDGTRKEGNREEKEDKKERKQRRKKLTLIFRAPIFLLLHLLFFGGKNFSPRTRSRPPCSSSRETGLPEP